MVDWWISEICNLQLATYNLQLATYNLQLATYNFTPAERAYHQSSSNYCGGQRRWVVR